MKRRRSFLLLEMMIALVIMAGIVACLFTGFYGVIKAKNRIKQERERVINLQRLKLRFALLFKDIIDVKEIPGEGYYLRYRGKIDPDPYFRSEIKAVLSTKNDILTLTCWPKRGDPRQEILSTNVNTIKLTFFNEKDGKLQETYPDKKPFMMKVCINNHVIPLFL